MKVRANGIYRFWPNLLDQIHNCAPGLEPGDLVRVVRLRGAPPPNTMGQCHVEKSGHGFVGMVSCNSLHPRHYAPSN